MLQFEMLKFHATFLQKMSAFSIVVSILLESVTDYDHGLDLSVKVLGEVEMLAPAYSTVTGSQQ